MGPFPAIFYRCWRFSRFITCSHSILFTNDLLCTISIPIYPFGEDATVRFSFSYRTPRHAYTNIDCDHCVVNVSLNSDLEHVSRSFNNYVVFNAFEAPFFQLICSLGVCLLIRLICIPQTLVSSRFIHRFFIVPIFPYIWVRIWRCFVPGDFPLQLILHCMKRKSTPHLNTAVTCEEELHLSLFLLLIGFDERLFGWSTTLP